MKTIISATKGKPILLIDEEGTYRWAETGIPLDLQTARYAYQQISSNMAGEPTKAAVEAGVIRDSWPYRLYDETNAEMSERLRKK